MAKKGSLKPYEKEFILSQAGRLSAREIAEKIDRLEDTVSRFIDEHWIPLGAEISEKQQKLVIRAELRSSEEWKRLELEFTEEELRLFEEKYVKIMGQFKSDVFPTEETQIMHSIKLEILLSRHLIARRAAIADTERLERMLSDILKPHKGDVMGLSEKERELVLGLENQLAGHRAAEATRTREATALQEQHARILRDIKGVRDQRIKDVESGKTSFLGLLMMLQSREQAEREGRNAELMRMACEEEANRLSKYHTYVDGGIDRPLLNADTVDQ